MLKGGILPAMWHNEPKNDAWRETHLNMHALPPSS